MDIPIVDMVLRSGWAARTILILLGIFSVITWAVIFNRLFVLGGANKKNKLYLRKYAGCAAIPEMEKLDKDFLSCPMGLVGAKGVDEYKRILKDSSSHTGVRDWSFFLQTQFAITLEQIDSVYSGL
jgi:biopolymer transport protein ExbB/TolQ